MEIRGGERKGVEKEERERCGSLHVARWEGKGSTGALARLPVRWVHRLRFSQTPEEKLFCGRDWARFFCLRRPQNSFKGFRGPGWR
jgi:hypothetical protein